jgi:hypothetical protein
MIDRLISFFKARNKGTLLRYFSKEIISEIKRSLIITKTNFFGIKSDPNGKLNFSKQLYSHYGDHRSGWNFAANSLRRLHHPEGILFDPFIERTFAWNPKGIRPHAQPWIGFIHVPPHVPDWFPQKQSNQEILNSEAWKASYPFCKGLFTLSLYHKQYLEKIISVPIENLVHPTGSPGLSWTWERFIKNEEKKIIQVGWWLRKLYSIYLLPVSGYQKIFLKKNETGMDAVLQGEFDHTAGKDKLTPEWMSGTRVLNFVSNKRYDQLLAGNILFLDLHDASANNTIIECIIRNTPILVNPIAPVIEYLGRDYPFYFNSLEEAAMKAENLDLVRDTHTYLTNHPLKKKLSGDYFRESLIHSSIYQSL